MKKYLLQIFILCFVGGIPLMANDNTSKKLTNKEQRKFDYYFYEALNAKVTNNHAEAIDFLTHCLSLDSTNANVYYELSNYLTSAGNNSKAYEFNKKAVELDQSNAIYKTGLANLALGLKDYNMAVKLFSELSTNNPDKYDLFLYLSESYRLNGDLENAIKALDRLEQSIGLNEKISLQKYQLYSMLKQEEKAFAEIQKHIDQNPDELKYKILLGNLYVESKRYDDAFKVYSQAKESNPDDPYLIISLAEYYEHVGKKDEAENEMETALVSPKLDVETKLGILTQYVASLNKNKQDTKKTNHLFETLMEQHPQEPDLNLMYGNVLLLQENKGAAYDQFLTYAESLPTNPLGWEQMLACSLPDSIDKAIYACEMGIKNLPEEPQFYFYLGVSRYIKKEYEPALTAIKKGLTFVDKNNHRLLSDFYGQMGDLYYQMNQTDSSFAAYEMALKHYPMNMVILNNYSYFLSLNKKDIDKAEKMSSLTIQAEPSNPTYLDTYGWILFKQGAYTMAKIYIEKSINNSEEMEEELSWEVLEHYGDVLFKVGEEEKALEYWIKAKETGKSNSPTLDKKIESKNYIAKDHEE